VPLTAFPGADAEAQRRQAQALLDTTVQITVCVDDVARNFTVALDNVAAGHSWPSGASQDRRAWVDVTAYAGDQGDLSQRPRRRRDRRGRGRPGPVGDPRLHLRRQSRRSAHVLAGRQHDRQRDPRSGHADADRPVDLHTLAPEARLPVSAATAQPPDRITVQVYLNAIGDDVLTSLVDSQDLDATVAAAVARYQLGGGGTTSDPRQGHGALDSRTRNQLCASTSAGTPRSRPSLRRPATPAATRRRRRSVRRASVGTQTLTTALSVTASCPTSR